MKTTRLALCVLAITALLSAAAKADVSTANLIYWLPFEDSSGDFTLQNFGNAVDGSGNPISAVPYQLVNGNYQPSSAVPTTNAAIGPYAVNLANNGALARGWHRLPDHDHRRAIDDDIGMDQPAKY